MGTDWRKAIAVADGFEAYDDLPERVLGYPTIMDVIELADPDVRTVLDYGCGPGKVALRLAQAHEVQILAVDVSARMLEIARSRRAHPRIRYLLIDDRRLAEVADGSIDAALCCYVFINVGDLDEIRAITSEVYRVLRPGGRFAVLDTNPDTTGVRFSTFRSGEPGRVYREGQQRQVLLYLPDGGELELLDYHWPRQTYADVLSRAGFGQIGTVEPRLGDRTDSDTVVSGSRLDVPQPAEAAWPPFLITTGVK